MTIRSSSNILFIFSVVFLFSHAEGSFGIIEDRVELGLNIPTQYCIEGSWSPLNIWDIMVVTIPYTSKELKYEVDSPDSNFIRAVTYLIGKVWPNYDFNVNALYDLREDQKNKSTEFYLSPYMSTCFELTLKSNPDEGFVEVPITRRYVFDYLCPLRLILGFLLFVFANRLSQSRSFYYITAASLSALLGVLLIILLLIKRYGSNNAFVGAAAVTYSIGLTSFFRHWFVKFFWSLCVNHYQLLLVYVSVFAFIGVLLVRLKVFTDASSKPTSLFDTVRWALRVISITLILNSTASMTASLLSFPVLFFALRRISQAASRLWIRLFTPKREFLSEKEYEESCQKYTVQEIQKLRQRLIEDPDLISRLKCPKPTLSLFLLTGMDIIDTNHSPQEIARMIKGIEEKQEPKGTLDLVYQQRNDRDEFLLNGKYKQMEAEEVSFSENDVNRAVQNRESYDYDDDDSDGGDINIDKDIYRYDSDHGNTCIYGKDKEDHHHADRYLHRKRREEKRKEELRERRRTLPSENFHIPTTSGWE